MPGGHRLPARSTLDTNIKPDVRAARPMGTAEKERAARKPAPDETPSRQRDRGRGSSKMATGERQRAERPREDVTLPRSQDDSDAELAECQEQPRGEARAEERKMRELGESERPEASGQQPPSQGTNPEVKEDKQPRGRVIQGGKTDHVPQKADEGVTSETQKVPLYPPS